MRWDAATSSQRMELALVAIPLWNNDMIRITKLSYVTVFLGVTEFTINVVGDGMCILIKRVFLVGSREQDAGQGWLVLSLNGYEMVRFIDFGTRWVVYGMLLVHLLVATA